ncbi:unnamed protein product [Chrysoparadoxa australica]
MKLSIVATGLLAAVCSVRAGGVPSGGAVETAEQALKMEHDHVMAPQPMCLCMGHAGALIDGSTDGCFCVNSPNWSQWYWAGGLLTTIASLSFFILAKTTQSLFKVHRIFSVIGEHEHLKSMVEAHAGESIDLKHTRSLSLLKEVRLSAIQCNAETSPSHGLPLSSNILSCFVCLVLFRSFQMAHLHIFVYPTMLLAPVCYGVFGTAEPLLRLSWRTLLLSMVFKYIKQYVITWVVRKIKEKVAADARKRQEAKANANAVHSRSPVAEPATGDAYMPLVSASAPCEIEATSVRLPTAWPWPLCLTGLHGHRLGNLLLDVLCRSVLSTPQ